MNQDFANEILSQVEKHLDAQSVKDIKASIDRPWQKKPKEWEAFLKKTLPSETFELSENVNGKKESYSFSMDLVRKELIDELLNCEIEIKKKLNSMFSNGNYKVIMALPKCIENKAKSGKSETWGELIDQVSPKGFLDKLFSSKQRWENTPIRLDSIYRIFWMISNNR